MIGPHFITRSGDYLFHTMGYAGSWYFLIPRLIGLVAIIVGIVVLVKYMKRNREYNNEAIYMLKLKYVNGEIDETEYKSKLSLIK